MTKKVWIMFCTLSVIILALSGTSSFLFFKNRSLQGSSAKTASSPGVEVAATSESSTTTTPSPSAQATVKPSSPSDRPSAPSDTYVIQKGETLFAIATKNDITWTELTAANGIADADKIKAGQTLIIPKSGEIAYTVDAAKVANIAKSVAAGKSQFRLDPVETAKADAYPAYGLQTSSTYTIQTKNVNTGKATVLAVNGDSKFTIQLTQPDVKGDKGIWAITVITPTK